jgi:hypothetical protein
MDCLVEKKTEGIRPRLESKPTGMVAQNPFISYMMSVIPYVPESDKFKNYIGK